MEYNEQDIATMAQARLKLPASAVPKLMTLIPAALNNLAKNVANDPDRRPLLMTDPETYTGINVTESSDGMYFATDLGVYVGATPGILLDFVRYGTFWAYYTFSFTSANVDPTEDAIQIANTTSVLTTGLPIRFTTTGTLPTGISASTTYYVIAGEGLTQNDYKFATTYANAVAGTATPISAAGSGNSVLRVIPQVMQWLMSPNQGSLESCLPIDYITGYLVGTQLRLNNVNTGVLLSMSVPYVPTLGNFPDDLGLTQDLIDAMVELYLSGDPAEAQTQNG